jgi:PadR family transcriptional regulator AphA
LPYWLMTLNFGRHRSRAFVNWARETLEELERLESGS